VENILINFSADPSGLQPGIDALAELGIAEKTVIDEVKKLNAEMDKASKKTDEAISDNIESIDELNRAFRNLSKSALGQTYSQVFKDLQDGLRLSKDEMEAFYKLLIKNSRTDLLGAESVEEIQGLQGLIDTAQEALAAFEAEAKNAGAVLDEVEQEAEKVADQAEDLGNALGDAGDEAGNLGDNADESADKLDTLQQQLKEVKKELGQMAAEGKDGTEEFAALTKQAGELTDRIQSVNDKIRTLASSNLGLDAVIEGVQGLVGGFAAIQGAVALFGDENEELEKALLKVNAALALLQGVQAVSNALKKESALMTAREIALDRIKLLQTNLMTAAESRNIIVRWGAVAAQKALNLVMAANPIGLVIIAIGALAAGMLIFARNTREAAAAQAELDAALRSIEAGLDAEIKQQERRNKKTLAEMREMGASDDELAQRQIRNLELLNEARQREIQKARRNYDKVQSDDEDALKKKEELRDAILKLEEDIKDGEVSIFEQRKDLDRKLYLDRLKNATAYAEAAVIAAKMGSRQELNAQIAAVRARTREALANANLEAGERVKIQRAAEKEIADLKFEFDKRALVDAKRVIDRQLLLVKEGSKEELDLRIEALVRQREIDLKEKGITENQILLIKQKALKDEQELIKAFNRQVAEDTINSRIAVVSSQLAQEQVKTVDETNRQIIKLKQDLIDEQARLEVVSVQFSEKNEELRRVKIKAIYDKALLDKKTLERQKQEAEIAGDQAYFQALYELEVRKNEIILQSQKSSLKERKKAQEDYFIFQKALIDNDEAALRERRANLLISEQEFQTELLAIKLRRLNQEVAAEEVAAARRIAINTFTTQALQNLSTIFFQRNAKSYNQEAQQAEELKEKKLISEEEYNQRMRAIRRKQDQDAKAQALFQMLISQGPTILQGFKQGGWVGVAAALALFTGLLGAVSSASPPGYKHGVIGIDGPGTGTSDSIPVRVSKGESIINAEATKKWNEALKAINSDQFEQYIMRLPRPAENLATKISDIARMSRLSPMVYQAAKETYVENSIDIDYDKMAEAFASRLAENPSTNINLDEDGFNVSVRKGIEQINYVNKKMNL
jgi:hypothetical protein